MPLPEFEDLPFEERPDLTPYLIHLTKNTKTEDGYSALDNLINILQNAEIWPSTRSKGFIKGPNGAVCFMDVPFNGLKYVLNAVNSNPNRPRYEPYGVFVRKQTAYRKGCRPVLYLSEDERRRLRIPKDELWRVVRFEATDAGWISWIHEREWRCRGKFVLPVNLLGVLVRSTADAASLQARIEKQPSKFKVKPKCIIPLSIMCQGLPKF